MGTDSKYLEEAMAELERSLGTFSNNAEINLLTINNLESRLDNVSKQDKHLLGTICDSPYTDTNTYYHLLNLIKRFEKDHKNEKYLYDDLIGNKYVRFYENSTLQYDLEHKKMRVNYDVENYVKRISSDVVYKSETQDFRNSLKQSKVTAKEIETGKKVYKYVVTYESKPILVEDTGHYITLETGCYKWVEE